MKKKRVILLLSGFLAILLLITAFTVFLLFWNGILQFNNPSKEQYPVRGVDVSAYQGIIDWELLSEQDISFAFIKATEGSSFVDERFFYNYAEAQKTNLRVGAYHFFSYDSTGEAQAAHFIRTVAKTEDMLPPVIDVEFYGDKEAKPPEREQTIAQLGVRDEKLKTHYGVTPILYATEKSYQLYLAGAFPDCDIWIRSVLTSPRLSDNRNWTFWQFSNRARLYGYSGKEAFIDLNIFYGGEQEFARYGIPY